MQYEEFVEEVQHRARLGSRGDAVRAIRATLETLAERLPTEEANHLAAQLPPAIGSHLQDSNGSERFTLNHFFERVAQREPADLADAVHHARAVISVLNEAVSAGQFEQVRNILPDEFNPLFESGSEGRLRQP